jgi:hypothetical protein
MLRRLLLSTTFVLAAVATAGGVEPVAPPNSIPTARPLIVTRPIFAIPATPQTGASSGVRSSAPLRHRQPLALVPEKAVEAPKTAGSENPAPPPRFGISTIPHHRRSLGW